MRIVLQVNGYLKPLLKRNVAHVCTDCLHSCGAYSSEPQSHVFCCVFLLEWEAFAFALRLSLGINRCVHFVQLLTHGSTLAYAHV